MGNRTLPKLTSIFMILAMGLAVPGIAHSDLTSRDLARMVWSATISDMPDFDQERIETQMRTGLRGDGLMFCGPTSAANVLTYIANHGYPEVGLGDGEWDPDNLSFHENRIKYERVTNFIAELGDEMDTDLVGDNSTGTNLKNLAEGIETYLEDTDAFDVDYLQPGDLPSHDDIGDALLDGGLVILVRGRYTQESDGTYTRIGGHIMPVIGASRRISTRELTVRNPITDETESQTWQSDFADETYSVTKGSVETDEGERIWRMYNADDPTKIYYLDSIVRIIPRDGYSLDGHD